MSRFEIENKKYLMHDAYAFYGGSKNRVYVNKRREGPGSGSTEADHGHFDQILLLDDSIQKVSCA